jgi:uncharacterized protein
MENVAEKEFSLKYINGEIITGDFKLRQDSRSNPAVFIIHGFKGFKDWGFAPYLAFEIAKNVGIAIIFNFSLNGYKPGSDLIVETENFAINTVSRELEELNFILSEFEKGNILEKNLLRKYWNGEIYLLGFSLGGGIAILTGSNRKNIDKIAVWSSVSKFDRWTDRQKNIWLKNGYMEFKNSQTKQVLRVSKDYIIDIENNQDKFSLTNEVGKLNCPLLILHGSEDLSVNIKEVKELFSFCNKNLSKFVIIPNAGHTFGCEHPFGVPSESLKEALGLTIDFFKNKKN